MNTMVLQEDYVADIFMNTSVNRRGSNKPNEFEGATVPENIQHHTGSREDIINLRNQGFKVDDDLHFFIFVWLMSMFHTYLK